LGDSVPLGSPFFKTARRGTQPTDKQQFETLAE
jgi:hypothetical protein